MARVGAILDAPTFDDDAFEALALDVFAFQYPRLRPYRRLCDARGATPDLVRRWQDIPAVPTLAFRRMRLYCGDEEPARLFATSGTSGARPGEAAFSEAGMALMLRAIEANAGRWLFGDGRRCHVLCLAPAPADAPRMIMAEGMAHLGRAFGLTGESRFFVGPAGLDGPGLFRALGDAIAAAEPVALVGASFGFVHLFDAMAARGQRLALPAGSRVLDAGGFKGRSREVGRAELLEAFDRHLGVPRERCVNVLGMTELASQLYDDARTGLKQDAPWTRTVVAPLPGADVADGVGLLRHLDLCNVERPLVVQTDDLGQRLPGGFRVLGRAAETDESRGCSLSVDALVHRGERP